MKHPHVPLPDHHKKYKKQQQQKKNSDNILISLVFTHTLTLLTSSTL